LRFLIVLKLETTIILLLIFLLHVIQVYYNGVAAAAIIVLIIFGFIVPISVVYYIMLKKNQKDTSLLELRLGFFFNKYHSRYYYWDTVDLFTKIFIIVPLVFASNSITKITIIIFFYVAVIVALINVSPYRTKEHNFSILLSYLALFFTTMCALYFFDGTLAEFQNSINLNVVDGVVLFVALLAIVVILGLAFIEGMQIVARRVSNIINTGSSERVDNIDSVPRELTTVSVGTKGEVDIPLDDANKL